MGSPLGPVLANIFIVELEKILIPKLDKEVKLWRRFVDDTICFAKIDSLNYILLTINSFHKNIKFTMEIEQNSMIPFLDVLLIRTPQKIHASAYRKKTNTNLYMHRNSFAPNNWKWGTLKTVVRRAYETCSTDEYLRDALKHIRSTFNEINNYPHWVISKVFKEIKNKQAYQRNISQDNNDEDQKQHFLVLPYKGQKGEQVVNSMRKRLNVVLPRNVKIRTCYTGKKVKFLLQN